MLFFYDPYTARDCHTVRHRSDDRADISPPYARSKSHRMTNTAFQPRHLLSLLQYLLPPLSFSQCLSKLCQFLTIHQLLFRGQSFSDDIVSLALQIREVIVQSRSPVPCDFCCRAPVGVSNPQSFLAIEIVVNGLSIALQGSSLAKL